jgi:hypothetical protein
VLIGRQTASALTAAHEQGIVHRDVKPQNLLIDAFGQVKLCDFGIASLARTEEFRTRTSAISMRYASPEDLEDDAEVGPKADVYSLGATLLHLAHGAPPTLKERLAPWMPPPTDDPGRAALDAVLADCLRPDPADRPTAHELLERLERLEWDLPDRRRALPVPPTTEPIDLAVPDQVSDPEPAALAMNPANPSDPLDLIELADDPTLYRTGRTPVAPARSAVPSRRRPSARTAIVGLAVVAAIVTAVVLLGGADADAPVPSTTVATAGATIPTTSVPAEPADPTIVERPPGLVTLDDPGLVWPLGAIGECLVQLDGDDTLRPVDCSEPHDLQRFAVGALDETTTSADQPDDAEIELAVADLCLDSAPELPLPELQIAQTNPSAATWGEGDRGYQCLLGVPGARLTGSALD